MMRKLGKSWCAVAISLGVLMGSAVFTFWSAEGFAYMSSDPEVCQQCHIMRGNYRSWSSSPHHTVTCNECHLPHGLVRKYLAKGLNGYHHSKAFTLGAPEVIQIKEGNSRILQENCVECHKDVVGHLQIMNDSSKRCVSCHHDVGHGK